MGRKILAMAVGLITGLATFAVIAIISTRFGLPPRQMEYMGRDEMAQYWSSRPEIVYLAMLFGWMLSSLAAGWITTKMSREQSNSMLALLVSAVMLAAGAVFFFALTPGQPYWTILLSLLSTIPIGLLGHRIARSRHLAVRH
jgi:hypothetical protein